MKLARTLVLALLLPTLACAGSGGAKEACADFPSAPYASFAADGAPLTVELRTAPNQPPERGVSCAELRITDAGAPRDGLTIEVVPWMPAHGHGSNVVPVVTGHGGGIYRVESIDFSMPGTWELRFAFKDEGLDAHATTTLDVR